MAFEETEAFPNDLVVNASSIFPDSFSTRRMTLRPLEAGDAATIFAEYAQDEDVTRYLTWRTHKSVEETEDFVHESLSYRASQTYIISIKTTHEFIGVFELRALDKYRMEFGYALARPYWGRGLMTEALAEVVACALRQPSVWRIGAVADIENIGSMRVMEKAGLRREGVLRRWLVHPNISSEPRDCVIFSATR